MGKSQTIRFEEQKTFKRLKELITLKKVGIHYFAKCIFCRDPGRHLCFFDGLKNYRCYNEKCTANGTVSDFFTRFNSKDPPPSANQLKIE